MRETETDYTDLALAWSNAQDRAKVLALGGPGGLCAPYMPRHRGHDYNDSPMGRYCLTCFDWIYYYA